MGDNAVIIEGVESEPSKESLYSTVHGARRVMSRSESDIMSRIFQLEGFCREALETAPLPEAPDLDAIEAFVLKCYGVNTMG